VILSNYIKVKDYEFFNDLNYILSSTNKSLFDIKYDQLPLSFRDYESSIYKKNYLELMWLDIYQNTNWNTDIKSNIHWDISKIDIVRNNNNIRKLYT
jgi:hypothetical protein